MAFVQKAEELIETPSLGMEFSCSSQMPLAYQGCGVAGIMQNIGNRLLVRGQSDARLFIPCSYWIVFIAETVRYHACHETCA
ncbi:hypothetical protein ES703_62401 [subsurface metagenome]